MIGRRLTERLKQHGWFAVGVDLLVVVVGILIALQVDAWAQGRADRRLERVYLQHLKEDLEIERSRMDAAERFADARIAAARTLSQLAADPSSASDNPTRVPWAIETASWRSFPRINAYVYGELQSSGRLVLIQSEQLRRRLAEHYTALQHDARVGEDLSAQQRFDAATAGLLSMDELEAIEQFAGGNRQMSISAQRAVALAHSFRRRPAALAELPSLVQHHTFNIRVIREMRARADSIIREIDALL